jgi:hypothetical protein
MMTEGTASEWGSLGWNEWRIRVHEQASGMGGVLGMCMEIGSEASLSPRDAGFPPLDEVT